MAQTKRRRQTKHRGNAAGMVESRGRTGRKPDAKEKAPAKGARAARPNRLDREPTWKGAFQRALVAVVFFALIVILLFRQNIVSAVVICIVMVPLYTVVGFYTDRWLYGRRQASLARKKQA